MYDDSFPVKHSHVCVLTSKMVVELNEDYFDNWCCNICAICAKGYIVLSTTTVSVAIATRNTLLDVVWPVL